MPTRIVLKQKGGVVTNQSSAAVVQRRRDGLFSWDEVDHGGDGNNNMSRRSNMSIDPPPVDHGKRPHLFFDPGNDGSNNSHSNHDNPRDNHNANLVKRRSGRGHGHNSAYVDESFNSAIQDNGGDPAATTAALSTQQNLRRTMSSTPSLRIGSHIHDATAPGAAVTGREGSSPSAQQQSELQQRQRQRQRRRSSSHKRRYRSSILQALSVVSDPGEDDDDDANDPDALGRHRRRGRRGGGGGGGATAVPHGNRINNKNGGSAFYDASETTEYYGNGDANANRDDDPNVVRLSADDIRASPRLVGYLFAMIASAVMLISVVQFYREQTGLPNALIDLNGNSTSGDAEKIFMFPSGAVIWWKLWGAITVASLGCLINLCTIAVHFDAYICPKVWIRIFRDGSKWERNYIIGLIVFWALGLHICTSSLSVGELQANVYFTTWIAFASILGNLSVWRESAGLPTLFDFIHNLHRETTYNWCWTLFFSLIFAGAITDIHYNRTEVEIANTQENVGESDLMDLSLTSWGTILAMVWTEVAVCFASIVLNECFYKTYPLPCRCRRKDDHYRCVVGWRQFEGGVIALALGTKFYVILVYTGVDGVINGLSNAYFGVWGSFFNSVFAFGSWVKENKNVTYIVREGDEDEYD